MLVEAAGLAPLRAGAVVGEDHDQRVVQRSEALERRQDAADLRVGVGQEAGEDLLLAGQHAPLLAREVGPGLHPLRPLGQHGALGHHTRGKLAVEQLGAPDVPSLVEHAPVGVDPLGRHVVRGMHGAEGEVQEEGLAGRPLLLVLHHADRLIGQVLAEVVALLGPAGRLDVVVVADEIGGPMVRVPLQEPVVALEAEAERPGREGAGGRALPAGGEVPLADGHRRVAGVAQETGERGRRLGESGVVAGEAQRDVGQEAHPHRVVVAPGEERCPRRGAQGGDVEAVERCAAGRQAVEMWRADVGAEGAQVAEAGVVQHDGDHIGRTRRRPGLVREAGGRLGCGEADLLRLVHGSRG